MRDLGSGKFVEAAPALAERLDMPIQDGPIQRLGSFPSNEDVFPAINALVEIGEHAVPAIVDSLATRDRSKTFIDNAVIAVLHIKSEQRPATIHVFQAASDNLLAQGEKAESERLLAVIAMMSGIPK